MSPQSPAPGTPVSQPERAVGNGGRGSRRGRGKGGGERPMVPRAEFRSYYGRPVLQKPVWKSPDVPGYLFLGGLAGASSVLAAAAQAGGQHELAKAAKIAALGGISLSAAFLINDLGRPARFHHMLRVFKLSSPMSVGSWLLAVYGPMAGAAAVSSLTGLLPWAGTAATGAAAVVGPSIATYTAALLCDTSVPAWHEAHREMPYLFAGSAASAAGGLAMLSVRRDQAGPAIIFAMLGAATELTAKELLVRRLGSLADPYHEGRPGKFMRAAELMTGTGLAAAMLARRSRAIAAISGAALVASSALTRFGVFEAGLASAADPKYTIAPQRARADRRAA